MSLTIKVDTNTIPLKKVKAGHMFRLPTNNAVWMVTTNVSLPNTDDYILCVNLGIGKLDHCHQLTEVIEVEGELTTKDKV